MHAEPGQDKSHTYCKRHYLAMMDDSLKDAQARGNAEMEHRIQTMVAQATSREDATFAPDLQQHPELVDHAKREQRDQQRAALRREQEARLARR